MSTERPMDDLLRAWFEEDAPPTAPSRVLSSAMARAQTLPQRRGMDGWRLRFMVPRLAAAGLVVTVVAMVVGVLPGAIRPLIGQPVPTPSPTASATPSGTPSPLPSGTRVFTTKGVTLQYQLPPGWRHDGEGPFDLWLARGGGSIAIGVLQAAVDQNSMSVAAPHLDLRVGITVSDFVTYLQEHRRIDTTAPRSLTISGYQATQVDVTLKPGQDYAQGHQPSRLGLAWFGQDAPAVGPTNGETHRFTLVDVAGKTLVLDTQSYDMAVFGPRAAELLDTITITVDPAAS